MPDQPIDSRQHAMPDRPEFEDGPTLLDGVRFIYHRRVKLLLMFVLCFGVSASVYTLRYLSAEKTLSGTVQLSFEGIEKHEYPTGRKFTLEDFRSPDLLARAMEDTGIAPGQVDLKQLAAQFYITPVIPTEVEGRWRIQERSGAKREEYVPNEFRLELALQGLSNEQRMRLFSAILKRFQDRVRSDQMSALGFVSTRQTSYRELAGSYDFWDLPALFLERLELLRKRLAAVIEETTKYHDARYQLEFREVADRLSIWYTTRLLALEALTYHGGLVKNRDITTQRVQYRIGDVEIRIRQKTQEAAEAIRLLAALERPGTVLAGQSSSREGAPVIDINALDRLIKGDYVGPVVQRISKLQEEAQALEVERARLQKQLAWLPKASNTTLDRLPQDHKDLVETLSSELKGIAESYNRLLDDYITETVTSKVTVGQSPVFTRGGYSPVLVLGAILLLSAFLSLLYITIEHLLKRVKEEERRSEAAARYDVVAR